MNLESHRDFPTADRVFGAKVVNVMVVILFTGQTYSEACGAFMGDVLCRLIVVCYNFSAGEYRDQMLEYKLASVIHGSSWFRSDLPELQRDTPKDHSYKKLSKKLEHQRQEMALGVTVQSQEPTVDFTGIWYPISA